MKKSTKTPWMEADAFGRSLPNGLGINLLVRHIDAATGFARHVFGAEVIY